MREAIDILKLILADDEHLVRAAIKNLASFNELDIELVCEASDGLEALELCSCYKPDILLTDIRMPGLSGIELVQELKMLLPETKVVIISGFNDFEYARTAMKHGVSEYLLKPVDKTELNEVLKRLKEEIAAEKIRKAKEESLKSRYDRALPILIESLLNKLILKNTLLHASLIEEFKEYGIQYTLPNFTLVVIAQNRLLNEQNEKKVSDYLKTLLSGIARRYLKGMAFSIADTPGNFGILINHGLINPRKDIEIPLNTAILLAARRGINISAGISSSCQSVCRLHELYNEASDALGMGFWEVEENSPKLYFLSNNSFDSQKTFNINLNNSLIDEIVFDIKAKSYERLYSATRSLFEQARAYKTLKGSPVQIKDFIWSYIQMLANRLDIHTSFISYETLVEGHHPKDIISAIPTLMGLKSCIEKMLEHICRLYEEKQRDSVPEDPIEAAKRIICENYTKDISLELISTHVHLSPSYFSNLFKKETDMSFTQFKTLIKIEEAKKLLLSTKLSVNEIGMQVGYADPKYFSRMFRRVTGLSPLEFKENALV